jgi:hypothetical protein
MFGKKICARQVMRIPLSIHLGEKLLQIFPNLELSLPYSFNCNTIKGQVFLAYHYKAITYLCCVDI